MKTVKLNMLSVAALTMMIGLSSMSYSADVVLPVISKPAVLQEGTQRDLTPAQIAELLPWAKDSKIFLSDLLDSIQGLSSEDKVDQLVSGITTVVGESAPKNSELLMRYVLNRGLVVNDILKREVKEGDIGAIDARIRVLVFSVRMAIYYYDTDMNVMTKKSNAPYASFGNQYFNFLNDLNKSIFDASAQYNIYRTSIEWLQWDLYRDLNNTSFAPQIVKMNNALKFYPNKKLSDSQSIAYIRQMKSMSQQLNISSALAKIDTDQKMALAKSEQEREALRQQAAERQKRQEEEEYIKKLGPIVQTVQVVAYPAIKGMYFSTQSTADGVCVAIGFQKAVPGEVKGDGNKYGSAVMVDARGNLIGAEVVDDKVGAVVAEIVCANKVLNNKNVDIVKIADLKLANDIIVSSESNANGVCKLLGYEKGLNGSGIQDGAYRGIMAVINEDGNATSANMSTDGEGARMSQVICINKLANTNKVSIRNISKPKISGQMISSNSDTTGVCRSLGFARGLQEGIIANGNTYGISMVVDVTGSVISTETIDEKVGASIDNILCIEK